MKIRFCSGRDQTVSTPFPVASPAQMSLCESQPQQLAALYRIILLKARFSQILGSEAVGACCAQGSTPRVQCATMLYRHMGRKEYLFVPFGLFRSRRPFRRHSLRLQPGGRLLATHLLRLRCPFAIAWAADHVLMSEVTQSVMTGLFS